MSNKITIKSKKKKSYHYVLVMTSYGPVFVTDFTNEGKQAFWNKEQKPLELGAFQADNICTGLLANLNLAYHIVSPIELDTQPYMYDAGHLVWEWNEGINEEKEDE